MSNITFDMPIDRTVTVITDGRNITNIVFDMNIPDRPDPICEKAKEQFLAYFDGRLKEFSLPYDISGIGTPFFRSILTAVQKIPYGERVTYMQAAEMAGSKAVRRTEKKGTGKRSFQRKEPGSDESGADGGASGFRERGGLAAAGG